METPVLFFLFVLAFASAFAGSLDLTGLNYGNCVQECNPSFLLRSLNLYMYQCPSGFECRSNGCGHTCQKVRVERRQTKCFGKRMCLIYCPTGHKVDENGCTMCECNYFVGLK